MYTTPNHFLPEQSGAARSSGNRWSRGCRPLASCVPLDVITLLERLSTLHSVSCGLWSVRWSKTCQTWFMPTRATFARPTRRTSIEGRLQHHPSEISKNRPRQRLVFRRKLTCRSRKSSTEESTGPIGAKTFEYALCHQGMTYEHACTRKNIANSNGRTRQC